MHIIIAFLTALVTLLYALERLGVDLGWLNPWAWRRRRAWLKRSTANPVFSLDKPIDAAALIVTAAAKIDGDISIQEKEELKRIFVSAFNLPEKAATQLLGASVFLLGSGEDVFNSPDRVLRNTIDKFTDEQKNSVLDILQKVVAIGGSPSAMQTEFVSKVQAAMFPNNDKRNW
ncbi:MAG: TerB family tellurite resistance protein [Marinagarivorans sp.]